LTSGVGWFTLLEPDMADTSHQAAFYEALGKNIRKSREGRGLRQGTLATLVGLTRTSLTNIENARQHPTIYTLCKIADQLKVSVLDLLPHPEPATEIVDVKKMAGEQVRDKSELQFIQTAISNHRSGLHGHQTKKDTDSHRKSSR
jgi:transcriptional regulator with XRE-family HTH domain